MNTRSILAFCLLALAGFVFAHGDHSHGDVATYGPKSPVITLTEDEFDDHLEKHPSGFIEFFAPWCGHCKTLKPIFEAAATQGKAEGIVFAAHDASAGGSIGSRYGVQGFPTIKYFKDGEAFEYEGDRTADAFLSFARKMSADPITKVSSAEAANAAAANHAFAVVGQFAAADESLRETFESTAAKLFLRFTFVEVEGAAAKTEIRAEVSGIEEDAVYAGADSVEALTAWIETNCVPLIDNLDGRTWKSRVVESKLGSFVAFVNPEASAEETKNVNDILSTAARTFRSSSQWFTANGVQLSRFADSIGAGGAMPRLAVICPANDDTKFAMSGDFTLENVVKFVEDYLAGKLVRVYKSAEPPASQDGPVFVLTQKTFQAEVLDFAGSVMVEFYAPWCGHCKTLAPIYDKVGEHFSARTDVRVAKLDMDANEISGKYGVRGFPTLLFFGAGNKDKPVTYSGERTFDGITSFINENAGVETDVEGEL